jgi:ABC-type bacteriocin/lantibiotic exporter with double-glycine peptidase domain
MEASASGITPVQRFWRLLAPDKKEITNVYLYAIFNGLVNLSLPLGIQAIVNLIQGGRISASWILLVAIVLLGITIAGILQILQIRITEQLQRKIFARSAFEFAYRIPQIKLEALFKEYAPELVNRFFDTLTVQKSLSKILIDFSRATLQILFGMVLLSFYHPFFILFSLFLLVFMYIIFKITAQRGLNTSILESKYKYKVAHWLEEVARTNTSFRLTEPVQLALSRTDYLTKNYLKARSSHFSVLIQQYSLLIGFKVIIAAGLLAIGGYLVMDQQMNVGQFVAAEIIILLIMTSVEKLITSFETIYDALTALEKIGQITDLPLIQETAVGDDDANVMYGNVKIDDVGLSYPGSNNFLVDLSLEIPIGSRIAIQDITNEYGEMLFNTLAGLYRPAKGTILIDGRAQSSYGSKILRKDIGYLPNSDQLFLGTIQENITVGRPSVSRGMVEEIGNDLGLDDYVNRLPDGYNTTLYPGDYTQLLGERKKILLARALVHQPKIVLLYQPFRYLNKKESDTLRKLLFKHPNQTIIAITQDQEFSQAADKFITFNYGGKVTIGSYPYKNQ